MSEMTDDEILRDDEKEALWNAESREQLKTTYHDDKVALLLRDRLIAARQALGEIADGVDRVVIKLGPGFEYEILKDLEDIEQIARTARKGEK